MSQLNTIYAETTTDQQIKYNQLHDRIKDLSKVKITNLNLSNITFNHKKKSNLYLTLYNQYLIESKHNAIVSTANYLGLEAFPQVASIINNNELDRLHLAEDLELAGTSISEVLEIYNQEKTIFQSLAILQLRSFALDVFNNGSTSDSEYDLVVDLEKIEKILFDDSSRSMFGDTFKLTFDKNIGSRSANNTVRRASSTPPLSEDTDSESGSGSSGQTATPDGQTSPGDSTNLEDTPLPPMGEDGEYCPIDSFLDQELNTYYSNNSEDESQDDIPNTSEDISNNQNIGSEGDNSSINESTSTTNPYQSQPNARPPLSPLPTMSNCPNGGTSLVDGLFCFRVEKVRTQAGVYYEDNPDCIACLINEIFNSSSHLVSKNLIPNKASGNFGEPPMCKKAGTGFWTMKISIIARPARSDLDLGGALRSVPEASSRVAPQEDLYIPDSQDTLYTQDTPTASITELGRATEEARMILQESLDDHNMAYELASELDSIETFIYNLEQRMMIFNQHFIEINNTLSELQTYLTAINQKNTCDAL